MKFLYFILLTQILCADIPYFNRTFNNVYVCQQKPNYEVEPFVKINIYEAFDKRNVKFNGKKYQKYRLSIHENEDFGFIRFEGNKIWYLPPDYKDYADYNCRSKEQLFFDFDFTINTKWVVCNAGIFTNSSFVLDSIEYDNTIKDSVYYVSGKHFIRISHKVEVINFEISKRYGFIRFRLLDNMVYGDTINCSCNNKW